MTAKPLPTDLPYHAFPNTKSLDDFLEENHSTCPGFYLKLSKKASGIPSVSADEAVESALCFGWINGWGRSIDDNWYFSRYMPRRPKSIWSQKNVDSVDRLTEQGRMRPAGMAEVLAAKADGRWARAYAGPKTIQVPADLEEALATSDAAKKFFDGLNKGDRFLVLMRLETGLPASRAKRMQSLVDLLAQGKISRGAVKKSKGEIGSQSSTAKQSAQKAKGRPVAKSSARTMKTGDEKADIVLQPEREMSRKEENEESKEPRGELGSRRKSARLATSKTAHRG